MLSTKKKWKIGEVEANFHVFWRSGLGNFMFYCCFVRFVVLLSALCYSNWFLHYVIYIGLSLPSLEVEFIPSIVSMAYLGVLGNQRCLIPSPK